MTNVFEDLDNKEANVREDSRWEREDVTHAVKDTSARVRLHSKQSWEWPRWKQRKLGQGQGAGPALAGDCKPRESEARRHPGKSQTRRLKGTREPGSHEGERQRTWPEAGCGVPHAESDPQTATTEKGTP